MKTFFAFLLVCFFLSRGENISGFESLIFIFLSIYLFYKFLIGVYYISCWFFDRYF